MTNSSFLKKIILALSAIFIISCDQDYNEIGADIIEDDIHHNTTRYEAGVVAYDRPTGAVQTNNLPQNMLGVYNNPAFGRTVASFVTQLEFPANSENPKFYTPTIDSVYLYVPYYSTAKESNPETGVTTYDLDSVYGDPSKTFRLQVYQNGFFLRDTDPGSTTVNQRYYSDDKALIEANKIGGALNNSEDPSENQEFSFSSKEVARLADKNPLDGIPKNEVVERKTPGIFLQLDKTVFQEKILNAPAGMLLNNNVFKNYFRGLYFKVEGEDGAMAVPQFANGTVTIIYKDKKVDINGNPTSEIISKTLTLNLKGNTVNFFENTYNTAFTSSIAASDPVGGDDRLYIKGGEGSMAFIDISQASLNALMEKNTGEKVLINEANLTFYVDKGIMSEDIKKQPQRVYLYDVKNRRPLYDYYTDASSNTSNPKKNKVVHGGFLEKVQLVKNDGTSEEVYRYKVRITNHINNIINKDSANVKLALVMTENINVISNAALKTPFTEGAEVNSVPVSSVIHPFGTVLYGSNLPAEDKMRLKLEIYYTKPN